MLCPIYATVDEPPESIKNIIIICHYFYLWDCLYFVIMAANCAAIKELDNPSLLESMEFSHEEVSPLPPASPSQRDGSKSPSPPLARRSQNKEPKRRLSPPPYSADLGKGNKLRTAEGTGIAI